MGFGVKMIVEEAEVFQMENVNILTGPQYSNDLMNGLNVTLCRKGSLF